MTSRTQRDLAANALASLAAAIAVLFDAAERASAERQKGAARNALRRPA